MAIIGIGISTFADFYIIRDLAHRHNQLSALEIAVAAILIAFGVTGPFIFFRPIILQLLDACFTVQMRSDHLIGLTIFGKPRTILFTRIERIITVKRYWFLRANILLIGSDGIELEIHHNIDYLGKCIEEIRHRSPNLKEVVLNGMDRIPEIWAAGNKHCML